MNDARISCLACLLGFLLIFLVVLHALSEKLPIRVPEDGPGCGGKGDVSRLLSLVLTTQLQEIFLASKLLHMLSSYLFTFRFLRPRSEKRRKICRRKEILMLRQVIRIEKT